MLATSVTRVEVRPSSSGVPDDLGAPDLPGSKSHVQRAMLLAAGSSAGVLLRGATSCGDVELLGRGIRQLGGEVSWQEEGLRVVGGLRPGVSGALDAGENATAARMLATAVSLLGGHLILDGAARLRERPMAPLFDLLELGGARCAADAWPLVIDARESQWPRRLAVQAGITTQVASGAVLGAALAALNDGDERVVEVLDAGASGYLRVTAAVARAFGHPITIEETADRMVIRVGGGSVTREIGEYQVPADPSAMAFPATLGAILGRGPFRYEVNDDGHPDHAIIGDLERLASAERGAHVELLELGSRPDTFPALCVAAMCRVGRTILAGAPALRGKECDRIAAMARAAAAAGLRCVELDDGLEIEGPIATDGPMIALPAPADHRVVMALSLLGAVRSGGVRLDVGHAVSKSWPGYYSWLARVADVRPET